ncbi:MAG: hypothetical protein ABIS01_06440, partial [Ferruginibacter sp.]
MAPEKLRILTFPQRIEGNELEVNVLVLPTTASLNITVPFPSMDNPANTIQLPQFINARPDLGVNLIAGLANYPFTSVATDKPSFNINFPANLPNKYEGLAGQFEIEPFSAGAGTPKDNAEGIKKYLPESYRNSFNFTNPRTRYAKTDDSYQCAMKKPAKVNKLFQNSGNKISWGRVIAFCLRQQDLAESIGILYRLNINLPTPNYFENGGWIYFNLQSIAPEYSIGTTPAEIAKELKIYAARIPAIDPATPKRQLFGAILFPVVPNPSDLKGQFDQLKIEAADYDDGYAKIVHAMQPVSANILAEHPDEIHVQKESGIRLGWDDEQILIWQNRQWLADPSTPGQRVDAPLGVFSYRVDVRETRQPVNPAEPWSSLTRVQNNSGLMLGGEVISDFGKILETGVQVFPTQINENFPDFWLPAYFTQWYGQSLVLPDSKAAQLDGTGALANPGGYSNINKNGQDNITAKPNQKGGLYDALLPDNFELKYGHEYEFRVRLADLTGGGPRLEENELNDAPKTSSGIIFKRYIAPKQLVLVPQDAQPLQVHPAGVQSADSAKFLEGNSFDVYRPRLGYPALLFTEMDTATAFQRLIDDKNFLYPDPENGSPVTETRTVGFFDPDVDKMMVVVEVKSLLMDNLASANKREPYLPLYSTFRDFPANMEAPFTIELEYQNVNSIFNPKEDLGDFAGFVTNIHDNDSPIVVPTSRDIRITLVPVCSEKNAALSKYFGFTKTKIGDQLVHAGESIQFFVRQEAGEELEFLLNTLDSRELRGIYLQPDPVQIKNYDTNLKETVEGKESEQVTLIKRLASQLDLDCTRMTLIGKPGERIVFGCSNRIRHTLAPDNSSLTFSTKNDLFNHWLCVVSVNINRDWSWDGLNSAGIEVKRTKQFTGENDTQVNETVGYVQLKKTASRLAIDNAANATMPDRSYTRIVFIDAVEPKKELGLPSSISHPFPNTIDVEYSLFANYDLLNEPAPVPAPVAQSNIILPVTTVPVQVPKVAAVGVALSRYQHNSDYSATSYRQKYLWFEFEEEISDPNDNYFARVLTYAPDPLLAFPNPDQLLVKQEDPALPVDPEPIRVITNNESNDFAGLDAMQPMEAETNAPHTPLIKLSKLHYLLPLPTGLHSESNELFGFFTYEIRVGHTESIWSTAQGRFGLPARVNGVQHPAPVLKCLVNQTSNGISATAQYSTALFNGKNVTSKPPKTEIWCMLYAQAKQADGSINRNILLDDRKLEYIDPNAQSKLNLPLELFISNQQKFTDIKQANSLKVNLDAPLTGKVFWEKAVINQLLDQYNLSHDSGLSVLAVEMMPRYDQYILNSSSGDSASFNIRPLSSQLGQYRILRTSPLAAAPSICCDD